jgi:hypothetical protein
VSTALSSATGVRESKETDQARQVRWPMCRAQQHSFVIRYWFLVVQGHGRTGRAVLLFQGRRKPVVLAGTAGLVPPSVLPFVNDEGMPCPVRAEPIPRTNDVAHQRSLFKARLAFSWADTDKSLFGRLLRQNVQMQMDSFAPETTAAAVAFRKKGEKKEG